MNEIEHEDEHEREKAFVRLRRHEAIRAKEHLEKPDEEEELVWEIPRRWHIY